MFRYLLIVLLGAAMIPAVVAGQPGGDPAERLAIQREAMARLAFMDGQWEGKAVISMAPGQSRELRQTERVGPLLGGTIRLIEGRGYEADGTLSFNAFAVVSYDVDRGTYRIRSYAHGYSGDYPFAPDGNGFSWEIPAGESTMRFTAEFKDGRWREVGERILPDGQAIRFVEMDLVRTGDANWQSE